MTFFKHEDTCKYCPSHAVFEILPCWERPCPVLEDIFKDDLLQSGQVSEN